MEEDEYRATYRELTSIRCVYEKALTNNRARCSMARHFWLADREGYACKSPEASISCQNLLTNIREKSSFVLKIREVDGPLPHNMELRVQVGGLQGLQRQLQADHPGEAIEDISALIQQSIQRYGSLDAVPFSEIMQSVVQFKGRKRRSI
jgi:hypothetical protein